MTPDNNNAICVVGCGNWGRNHIRTLHEFGILGGIVDRDVDTLKNLKITYPSISVFDTVLTAIESMKFTGFVVATPADTHYEITIQIINAGYHVLVEKPVTLNIEDACSLKEAAEAQHVNLMAGHVMLFHPAIQKIKEMLDLGIIGDFQYIYSNRLNLGAVRTKENVFWSLAPHDISIFQYFMESMPLKITSTGGAFLQNGIHDTTLTVLEYEANIKGHIYVSWLHPFKEHRLIVIGSQGMISYEDSVDNKPLKLYSKSYDMSGELPAKQDGSVELIPYRKEMPLTVELKYFIQHLDGSPLKIANADNAVEVVDILVQASQSLKEGIPVE